MSLCVQGVPVVAIASDIVRDEYGGVDDHVTMFRYVPTQRDPATGVYVLINTYSLTHSLSQSL